MSVIPVLKERLDHADAVLRSARRLERLHRTARRAPPDLKSVAVIRAGVYIVLYNAFENSIRAVFASLRTSIQADGVVYNDAQEFWQQDFLKLNFIEKMQQGTNHGNIISDFTSSTNSQMKWAQDKIGSLPLSGNFGQDTATELRRRLPLDWQPPQIAGNGYDLEDIRRRRNELSHGFEQFDLIGARKTSSDMFEMVGRTRSYMLSFVSAIEEYRDRRAYIRS